jgi:hypothetical protein
LLQDENPGQIKRKSSYEVTCQIRKQNTDIKIIAQTACASFDEKQKVLNA